MDDGRHRRFIREFLLSGNGKKASFTYACYRVKTASMGGKAGSGRASTQKKSRKLVIWHNPRCSKSRQTLKILRRNKVPVAVREYLDDVPSAAEIKGVLQLLGIDADGLLRKKEAAYRALGLDWPDTPASALVKAMTSHPELIERPVVFSSSRAVIGRPPENVRTLF